MIPISTDAPIYYWPIATVTTIVLNVVCFLLFCLDTGSESVALVTPDGRLIVSEEQLERELDKLGSDEEVERFLDSLKPHRSGAGWVHTLSVEFGSFKPWQWVTNSFMHAGWGHLIGNMIFLWAFGLIVEGKVGHLLFAAIYLGIGTLYGLVLQLSSLVVGWDGIALGASAAIFGLLALCIAWAPANEFTVLLRFGTFDISILMYGFFFVAKEIVFWSLSGFQMSSELLHILGFVVALPVGLWMVTSGRVDCEGWDIFSYLANKTGNESTVGKVKAQARLQQASAKEKARASKEIALQSAKRASATQAMVDQVQQAIDQGAIETAIKLQDRITLSNPMLTWKQRDLYRVVQALLKQRNYDQALPLLEKHIELFEQSRVPMQVALMKIWLSQHQPRRTLAYLKGFNPSLMLPDEVTQLKQVAAAAKKQIAAGIEDG